MDAQHRSRYPLLPVCSCFLNCVLQALASLPAFGVYLRDLIAYAQMQMRGNSTASYAMPSFASFAATSSSSPSLSLYPSSSALVSGPSSVLMLQQFLACIQGEVTNPTALYRTLTSEATQFRGFQQNDSHELFVSILDLLAARTRQEPPSARLERDGCRWDDLLTAAAADQPRPHAMDAVKPDQVEEEELKDEPKDDVAFPLTNGFHPPVLADPSPSSLLPSAAPPADPFVGLLAQFLVCQRCQYRSPISHSSFNALSLPLPRHPALSTWDVHRCLLEFCSAEEVEGVRCAMCSALDTRKACRAQMEAEQAKKLVGKRRLRYARLEQQAAALERRILDMQPSHAARLQPPPPPTGAASDVFSTAVTDGAGASPAAIPEQVVRTVCWKRIALARLPRALCLHLNRLRGDHKLTTRVDFPLILNLAYFTAHQDDYAAAEHKPTSAADSSAMPRAPQPRVLYRLCSVVCHHGGSGSGHYTCYRQHDRYRRVEVEEKKDYSEDDESREKVWVHVSDDQVRRVTTEEVMACEAYMLFYQRIDR